MVEVESRFELDELFFSKTNLKGTIQSGNAVFVRVSEYETHEILNKPHSIIRHPETPRALFKIFWDFLKAGKPIAAYVKNRSKSGKYYWVFAMAFPMKDGYLSIRLKPTSPLFVKIQKVYDQVRYFESMNSDLDKSVQMAGQALKDLGFTSYDDFMQVALIEEMISRDHQLESLKKMDSKPSGVLIRKIVDDFLNLINGCTHITRQAFFKTQVLSGKMEGLVQNSEAIAQACSRVKLVTMNLTVSSAKLGAEGKPLGVVSNNLEVLTREIAISAAEFESAFHIYSKSIRDMYFSIAISRFQIDMMKHLTDEVIHESKSAGEFAERHEEFLFSNCRFLQNLVVESFSNVAKTTAELYQTNQTLLSSVRNLRKIIAGMSILHVMGKIEIGRMVEKSEAMTSRLEEMAKLTEIFKTNLRSLEGECSEGALLCREILDEVTFVARDIQHIGTTYANHYHGDGIH